MTNSIVTKIEEILGDDRNFSTRTGLRFTLEVIRDAFKYIDDEKANRTQETDKVNDIDERLENVERDLHNLITDRQKQQDKAEDERKYYRRLVIGGLVTMLISQLAILVFR